MLQNNISNFLDYCKNSDFSERSLESLSLRLNEFDKFIQANSIPGIVNILVIQDLLGHATPRATADYYIHPSEKKVREALEKLPAVIYLNKLVQSGLLKFQLSYKKRE